MHGELNGNILIHGDKTEATAKGQLTLGPFEIKIPERFKEKIPELNTKEIVIEEDKFSYPLHFNIDLVTTDRVFIRGWGVDTRLNGNLKISGDNNSPFGSGYAIENSRLVNGTWREIFNSDAEPYGGNRIGNLGGSISSSNGRIYVVMPANGFVVFQRL